MENKTKNLKKSNNDTEKLKPLDKITIYKKLKEKDDSEEEKSKISNENNDLNKIEKKNLMDKKIPIITLAKIVIVIV